MYKKKKNQEYLSKRLTWMDFRSEKTTTCVPKAPSLLLWQIKFCRTVLPIHLYTIHGLFHVPLAELNNCNRHCVAYKTKKVTISPFQKKFPDLWLFSHGNSFSMNKIKFSLRCQHHSSPSLGDPERSPFLPFQPCLSHCPSDIRPGKLPLSAPSLIFISKSKSLLLMPIYITPSSKLPHKLQTILSLDCNYWNFRTFQLRNYILLCYLICTILRPNKSGPSELNSLQSFLCQNT